MPTRRSLLSALGVAGATVLAGCTDGDDPPRDGDGFTVTSPAFDDSQTVPAQYTANGENVSPPLSFEGIPDEAETLAVVADDPDAPSGTFVHWLLWNLPGARTDLPGGVPAESELDGYGGARQGTNDFGEIGYSGPAPPEDDDPHTYRFDVIAVDTTVEVAPGAERSALEDALDGSTLESGRLTGTYGR